MSAPREHSALMDLSALLGLAVDAATAAGELVRLKREEFLGSDYAIAGTKSSLTDVVTESDVAAERLIKDVLLRARPADGFLGEESSPEIGAGHSRQTDQAAEPQVTWIVDPIDGTVNYVRNIAHYAVSIAAAIPVTGRDGRVAVTSAGPDDEGAGSGQQTSYEVVAGVVFNPVTNELFTATAGGGAVLSGRRLQLGGPGASERPFKQALIATGFSYHQARRRRQAEIVAQLLPAVGDIRRFGAASLDLCSVASGRVDAYYERGLNPWDIAAGALIAAEAGAVVSGLADTPNRQNPGYALTVAARAGVHSDLVRLLAGLRADED